jgi:plastocyanin
MRTSSRLAVVAVAAVLALGGCGGGGGKGGGKTDEAKPPPAGSESAPLSGQAPVDIVNFAFAPQKVVVKPGTTVTWTNKDTTIHDIKDTSPLNTPQSKDMNKGDTFSITYNQPGTYSYICGIHQYMTGTVEVVA